MGSIGANNAVVDQTPLFSSRVQKWEPGAIRSLLPLEALPGMISLVAGKPSPETFPIAEITISLKGAPKGTGRIVVDGDELNQALQYGLPRGNAQLIQVCSVAYQELIHRVIQVFTDPGDPVLLETWVSLPLGVAGFLRADGQQLIPVYSDAHGLDPASLEQALSKWPGNSPRPKVLYTTPTGSNPTGQSCIESRKAEILRLAKRFNFIILEDDAYYYLNYGDEKKRARSYLALEREVNGESGRVVRFDSLSKIVSPGMRLGILTAPAAVVDKVVRITENINLQPSSTTQLLALSLLRHWGQAGFLKHCAEAAEVYRRRRDVFVSAAKRHLQGRATWVVPTAGMFVWLELKLPPGMDSFELLRSQGMKNGVLAIPGVAFMPGGEQTCYIRVSFSLVPEGDMDEACRRIAGLVDGCACHS
ncbi:aminotransferase-like domain-containing protein [Aspergillus foveolatus]|uniref:aminotransferase-like domain-containing protein n=1 Tax=Aspergillus foveolatus TaxID=210207 RepID=UPI003CCD9AA0